MSLHTYPAIEQGTDQWHDIRRGLVTASVVGKLLTSDTPDPQTVECPACHVKVGPCLSLAAKKPTLLKTVHSPRSALAASLPPVITVADNETSQGITATLVAERICGFTEDMPMTSDMWRGVEAEPYARDIYGEHYAPVTEVGFMLWEDECWSLGYSPDGLVGDDGLIEIKSPRAKTHLKTILADEVPAHYMGQCQAGLLVSGREWIDFVSYCGGMPLFVKRVLPDMEWRAAIRAACVAFEANATQIVADYRSRVADLPTTERIDYNVVELKLA